MMCKINKSEIAGGPLSFFHALFGRCSAFSGHFLVNVVTSEGPPAYHHQHKSRKVPLNVSFFFHTNIIKLFAYLELYCFYKFD